MYTPSTQHLGKSLWSYFAAASSILATASLEAASTLSIKPSAYLPILSSRAAPTIALIYIILSSSFPATFPSTKPHVTHKHKAHRAIGTGDS